MVTFRHKPEKSVAFGRFCHKFSTNVHIMTLDKPEKNVYNEIYTWLLCLPGTAELFF